MVITETKFTAGPWSYVRNPEGTRWIIDSDPAHAIACTAGYEPDNESNARLISAAPELYEALTEARTTLSILRTQVMAEIGRCSDPSESRWEGVPEKLKDRLDAIDAALAKSGAPA